MTYMGSDVYYEEDLSDFDAEAEDALDELSDYYEGAPDFYEEEDYYEFPENWEE